MSCKITVAALVCLCIYWIEPVSGLACRSDRECTGGRCIMIGRQKECKCPSDQSFEEKFRRCVPQCQRSSQCKQKREICCQFVVRCGEPLEARCMGAMECRDHPGWCKKGKPLP